MTDSKRTPKPYVAEQHAEAVAFLEGLLASLKRPHDRAAHRRMVEVVLRARDEIEGFAPSSDAPTRRVRRAVRCLDLALRAMPSAIALLNVDATSADSSGVHARAVASLASVLVRQERESRAARRADSLGRITAKSWADAIAEWRGVERVSPGRPTAGAYRWSRVVFNLLRSAQLTNATSEKNMRDAYDRATRRIPR